MRFLDLEFARWWQLLPVLVACWALRFAYVRAVQRRALIAPRFARLSRRSTRLRELAVLAVTLVAGGALLFALLRPQVLLAQKTPELERQDLIILLDRSASMRAHDVAPSRFARATLEIRNFLQHKPEGIDRVGLVGFADASLILSYLTTDLDTVAFYLDWINGDPQTLLGTDIGAALKSGLEVARKDDRPTRKVFVLISDGEDYGEELNRQLNVYRTAGFHVHCIGIGSDRDITVPILGADGKETVLRDEAGRPVMTKFSESTLRQIAGVTGGHYIRSTAGNNLVSGLSTIVNSERRIVGWKTTTEYRDLYPAGLAVAGTAVAALWLLL
jgi:Ca-activated chloride channel family protein